MVEPRARRSRDEPNARADDDPELSQPGAHGVEKSRLLRRGAVDELAFARHDLQLKNVVDLRPESKRLAADAADRESPADAQFEEVNQHGRRQPLRDGLREQVEPADAAVNQRVRLVHLVNLRER